MVLHFLFELFYLIYPALFAIASFPLRIFSLFEPLTHNFNLGTSPWIGFVIISLLPAFGVIFTFQMIHKFRNSRTNSATAISRAHWQLIFTVAYCLALGMIAFQYFFASSFILTYLTSMRLFVPFLVMGMTGIGAIIYYFFNFALTAIFKRIDYLQQHPFSRGTFLAIMMGLGMYPFFLTTMLSLELFVNPLGNPQASRFFVVNAAIKNTCFIDPIRNNCPQKLEEIEYIESTAFKDMVNGNQVFYTYDREANLYTLVIRYAPLRAVIFDWRLVSEHGVDFHDYEVSILGQDRLIKPPAHLDQVVFPEWEYLN